ncbi:MAG: FadR/GntR family transcriptional regulator [Robiginitomaculum sp.]
MGEFKVLRASRPLRPYQKLADALLADIRSGAYPANARLPSERAMAEQFGVGRPVIREAIIALEIIGAVSVKRNSGIFVLPRPQNHNSLSVDLDVGGFELLEARRLIEGEIAYLAASAITEAGLAALEDTMDAMRAANGRGAIDLAEKHDDRFHAILAAHVNNSVLQNMVTEMSEAQQRSPLAKKLFARIHGQGLGRRIAEHEAILTALKARNAKGAREAMRHHLSCVLSELLAANKP